MVNLVKPAKLNRWHAIFPNLFCALGWHSIGYLRKKHPGGHAYHRHCVNCKHTEEKPSTPIR